MEPTLFLGWGYEWGVVAIIWIVIAKLIIDRL